MASRVARSGASVRVTTRCDASITPARHLAGRPIVCRKPCSAAGLTTAPRIATTFPERITGTNTANATFPRGERMTLPITGLAVRTASAWLIRSITWLDSPTGRGGLSSSRVPDGSESVTSIHMGWSCIRRPATTSNCARSTVPSNTGDAAMACRASIWESSSRFTPAALRQGQKDMRRDAELSVSAIAAAPRTADRATNGSRAAMTSRTICRCSFKIGTPFRQDSILEDAAA